MERQSNDAPLFRARDLEIHAGCSPLLERISFELGSGQILSVNGPSGIGKSSLLRGLAGLESCGSGSVQLEGRDPAGWGWTRYRRQVNLLFQKPLLLEMSLRENLELSFAYTSAEEEYPADLADELLDRLGLAAKRPGEDPRSFSVGEQQRVCLVRSLLNRPNVLLLDEPTSALDGESSRLVHELIESERAERGMAVVLAAHDPIFVKPDVVLDLAKHRVGEGAS